ncbi:hypothetical protein P3S68_016549 [Capsicum galapagoense]
MADMVPFTKERMWRKMLPYMITHAPLMLDTVLPKGVSKENIHHYRQLLLKYLTQIDESDGFDIDVYPGDCEFTPVKPYLDFEEEAEMLNELAVHAIQGYNNGATNVCLYSSFVLCACNTKYCNRREIYMIPLRR